MSFTSSTTRWLGGVNLAVSGIVYVLLGATVFSLSLQNSLVPVVLDVVAAVFAESEIVRRGDQILVVGADVGPVLAIGSILVGALQIRASSWMRSGRRWNAVVASAALGLPLVVCFPICLFVLVAAALTRDQFD